MNERITYQRKFKFRILLRLLIQIFYDFRVSLNIELVRIHKEISFPSCLLENLSNMFDKGLYAERGWIPCQITLPS